MGRSLQNPVAVAASPATADQQTMEGDASAMMMLQERIVFLSGDVTEHSITSVQAQLIALANISRAPIRLIVSTYGGSIDEMFSLYDTMKLIDTPVYTIGLGKVMSAGVLLLAAGAKGKRLIGPHARLMIHPVSGGFGGNVFEMKNDAAETGRLHDLMVDALVDETKMKKADLQALMSSGHDCYITPARAIQLGIVDSLIVGSAEQKKVTRKK